MTQPSRYLTVIAVIAGCGLAAATSTAARTAKPKIPAGLIGRYMTTLHRSDFPKNPHPELTDGSLTWTLTISRSGGIDNGPAFTIANAQLGVLESSSFTVKASAIRLHQEVCEASGTQVFYDNRYRYRLSGKTLHLTTIHNGCPDEVAKTILTSRPWRKVR